MKKFTFMVKLSVAQIWVEDGFDDPKEIAEQMEDMLLALLPFSVDGELEIVVTPTQKKTHAKR